MGWVQVMFCRLTMWSSKKRSSNSESSYYPLPVLDDATATGVPELTLRELNKATRSFSAASLIGRGYRTAVYRASLPAVGNKNNVGKAAAVAKRLDYASTSDDEFLRQQVLVLSRLRHDNVVRLLGYTIDAKASIRVLLFEFADMGTLHDALHGPTGAPAAGPSSSRSAVTLSWEQRTGIALDVARGLEYLHDVAAVCHCGISSTNVLLFQGFRAKIADYDVFKQLPQEVLGVYTEVEPVSWYCPPEYVDSGHRSYPKFDVYSYGVVLLELLTGRKRCKTLGNTLKWAAALVREGRVEEFMDPKLGTQYPPARALKLASIALCCVEHNPKSRPSMGDVAQMIRCHCHIVSSETSVAN